MNVILRSIGAIIAAFVVAIVLLTLVEVYSAVVHPVPPDFKNTPEEMVAHVARYPHWVLATAVPMWGLIAFLATWLAGWLGYRGCAIFMALLLLAALACNLSMLPYPLWFKIVQSLAVLIAVAIGVRLSHWRQASTSLV